MKVEENVAIIVMGGSGHLARTKIYPALFHLFCRNALPENFAVVGFGRTPMNDERFRSLASEHLACKYTGDAAECGGRMREFLSHLYYRRGTYDSVEDLRALKEYLRRLTGGGAVLLYMALPSQVLGDLLVALHGAGLDGRTYDEGGWIRVVFEKPFGRDRGSYDELAAAVSSCFEEEQIYRIDHYLGKELVQNLLVLRFANSALDALWNATLVESVLIEWKEPQGMEGRGRYFDGYGIIRDVMQNHLLQILAFVAMEEPLSLDAGDLHDEKVRLLRRCRIPSADDFVVGQYRGYTEEEGVAPDSITPTFAAVRLFVNSPRWRGVPFVVTAGKRLDAHLTQVRIRFKPSSECLFCVTGGTHPNELVIRIQPEEAVYFNINTKRPGEGMQVEMRRLDMLYSEAFKDHTIPDAYEALLLEVLAGRKAMFLRDDEVRVAWDIFTPALEAMERERRVPVVYEPGGAGPAVIFPGERRNR